MRTSSLLAKRPLNPRELMAHLFSSMRATCKPGTIRNASGMLVAPERRMSSCVITKMAAAASASFWVLFETEVTCTFIKSSTLIAVTSGRFCANALGTKKSTSPASNKARMVCLAEAAFGW